MPRAFALRLKHWFWKLFGPFFPSFRDLWLWLGFIKHNERQPYLFGRLKSGLGGHEVRQLLAAAGFSNDYIAWIDPDEVVNMRKVVNVEYQYHVRLFNDGEIKGHHEFAAEAHPFKHLYDVGMESGEDYLKPLLAPLLESAPLPLARPNPKSPPPDSAADLR